MQICPKCRVAQDVQGPPGAPAVCKQCGVKFVALASNAPAGADQARTMATPLPPSASGAGQDKTMITPVPPSGASKPAPAARPPAAPKPAAGEEDDPLVGKTLGGYRILRKLGQGGMGAVYEAHQISLDRSVALKVLPAALAAQKDFLQRFLREAHAVAQLNHNNIIQIYDVGKADGTYFYAMEFVRGQTLDRVVKKQGALDATTACGYILQAARGLEYAHRKGIIHRDVKPENIMINEDGVAKVADLGLAKRQEQQEEMSLTLSGVAMGTPYYISPEQATNAKHVDQRADIYSLGCTLYYLLAGKIPFDGASSYEVITKHINTPPILPHEINKSVPQELSKIVGMMLAKKPEDRFQNMMDVIHALEGYLGVSATEGWLATEDEIGQLREQAKAFGALRGDRTALVIQLVLGGLTVLGALLGMLFTWRLTVGSLVGGLAAAVTCFAVDGMQSKTTVYRKVRRWVFEWGVGDWVTACVAAVVIAGLVPLLGLGLAVLIALTTGVTAGMLYYAFVARRLAKRRAAVLEDVHKLTRRIRRRAGTEEAIQLFLCRYGEHEGEAICEAMFGYEAVLAARTKRPKEELEQRRRLFNAREWLIARLDAISEERAQRKDARRKALAESRTVVLPAQAPAAGGAAPAAAPAPAPLEVIEAEVLADVPSGKSAGVGGGLRFLIGAKGRVILGALMLLLTGLVYRKVFLSHAAWPVSPSYVLFALALVLSGVLSSFAGRICLGVSALLTGPLAIVAHYAGWGLGKAAFGEGAEGAPSRVTWAFLLGAFFFLLAFVAAFVLRGRRAPAT